MLFLIHYFLFAWVSFSVSAYGGEPSPLVVGMELSYPPFEMIDPEGNPAGISVEIAQALGRRLKREIKIENIPFLGLIPALKTAKVDLVLSSMSITRQRKASINFSEPYLKIGLSLLVGISSPLQAIAEGNQPHYKFVVKAGTSGEVYARQHLSSAEVIVLDKETACVLEVVQGKVDAFIYDILSVYQNWEKNPQTTRPILKPFTFEEWGIGVRKGNEALLSQVNHFLHTFKAESGIEKIMQKYLSPQIRAFQEMGLSDVFHACSLRKQ